MEINNLKDLTPSEQENLIKNNNFLNNNYTYIRLYISSINRAKLIFTNKLNQKFYPNFTSIYFSSWMHKQQDMDGAGFIFYEDPLNSAYYQLKPFQTIFNGLSRRSQDLWSLNIAFILPGRFTSIISSLEFEEVKRINSSDGMHTTPFIQLEEWRVENGQTKVEVIIKENLPTTNTDYKKYTY